MEGSLGVGVLGGYCCCIFLFLFLFFTTCSASLLPIGIHPLDDKYYASEVIKCKDGSKSLTRDRINDDFCDCLDGTDEPGTSACPTGKFYCKNVGSTPQFLFSSRVNDQFCGLKIFIILQAILISFVVAFGLFRRRGKLRRRHIHRPSLT
ncbi:hypothetical protein CsSME_00019798 [Camellia sinensis var. sinensis]